MAVKNWQQILDEERMREGVKRHRRRQGMNGQEWFALVLIVAVFAAFIFSLLWQGSGRGQIL